VDPARPGGRFGEQHGDVEAPGLRQKESIVARPVGRLGNPHQRLAAIFQRHDGDGETVLAH
jgi:hypothetical protein